MKSIIKYTFLGALTLMAATACTDNFEDINTNPHEATEDMLEKDGLKTGSFFSQMVVRMIPFTAGGVQDDSYGSTGSYQHFQGLNADWYSGYIGATGTWKSSVHNGCYSFSQEWGNSMYKQCFTQIMPAWQNLAKNAIEMNQPQVKALGDVVKVLAMHRVTDYYGPIPYTSFKQGNVNAKFDSQETIYKRFFEELDSAIDVLTPYAQSGAKIMSKYDYVYEGDALKWTKLANTLRLRLALRVVYVDPTLAKTEGEKSAASPVGFLEAASDDAEIVSTAISLMNPLYEQAYSWGEERMSATMDSYLNGLKDPRLSKYFKEAADGGYHGVRQGADVNADKDSYRGSKISNLNLTAISPIYLMKASESYFLRAEAAEHIGLNHARCHSVDPDAGGTELLGQRFGQANHSGLGGGVGGLTGGPDQSPHGRRIQNYTVFSRQHGGQGGLNAQVGAGDINIHDPPEGLRLDPVDGTPVRDARIVDQHIHLRDLPEGMGDLRLI